MRNMIIFDTLAYANKLKDAGFTDIQAEVQAEGLAQILETNIATKKDIAGVQKDIADVRRDIQEMGYKLTIRMGGMLVVMVTVLAAMKFFD